MKIKVHVSYVKEYDIDERVITTLYNVHRDPNAGALFETYEEAEELMERITGLPMWHESIGDAECITAVYAEDDTPILET